ncbi:MAG: electron transport complex subunit RsxC [Bacteroidales bacterium]|nr:electron transport complex subunit RsxC [Bacteroidales bacterium]
MLKTFPKGGVHPAENKLSKGRKIERLELPKLVQIPLSQHIGAPSQVVVSKGDKVLTGQVIAKSGGFVSANIHSSVSGTVSKIDKFIDASGYKQMSIIIDVEGDDWLPQIDKNSELKTDIPNDIEEIKNKLIDAGIVGMGGAGFPTHVKASIPQGKTAKHLIINAVECEPYLTADHQLMMEKADEIIIGVMLLQKLIGAEKSYIGIENNKPDAIKHIKERAKKHSQNIIVQGLKVKYPQGGEKQLIKALVKREVPSGGLPIDVGCVVQNVGTAFAVYEAVQKNKPLFERVVTVTGKSLKNPVNVLARIGTPISELIEYAGGLPEDTAKIVSGGPMMGKAIADISIPVTKTTSGVLIINEKEALRPKEYNCIRCGRCAQVCPMSLEPYLLKNIVAIANWEDLQAERVLDCIECGSCSFTCPAGIPLLDYIRLGKNKLNQILRSRKS